MDHGTWDVGHGKESGGDSLIRPHPNTVLKIVDLMKYRAKREAFLVADQESMDAKTDESLGPSSEGEEGSGKGRFARLVSVESKEEEEERSARRLAPERFRSLFADYL